ncbi:hypothetical protein DPMN_000722 [Dreissena polymorpha]|uniref:Uncharacterized protein n=1 Tax=Dreissena polymorpha TaxID=45954 RepID=A0A9D4RPR3_DREPO|nr:hypothetical protein DPMN_000722 [Dreissena polymorpha]
MTLQGESNNIPIENCSVPTCSRAQSSCMSHSGRSGTHLQQSQVLMYEPLRVVGYLPAAEPSPHV